MRDVSERATVRHICGVEGHNYIILHVLVKQEGWGKKNAVKY